MIIEKLNIRQFRNYSELTLTPHPGVNLLFGQNGSGKTNLLEAIHYCALGKSHRTSADRECVRRDQQAAFLGVTVSRMDGRSDIAIRLNGGEERSKAVFIDRKRVSRLSEMMGRLQCVIFSPEDLQLVKGGPAVRRRYLDMMISQISTPYFVALQQYQRAMEQRNAILREMKKGESAPRVMLDEFEAAMAGPAALILEKRREIASRLSPAVSEAYRTISGRDGEKLEMSYAACLEAEDRVTAEEDFRRRWRERRQDDVFRGGTSFGVHREDLELRLNGREMKFYASQGQIRTAVLSVKLAQIGIFRELSGEAPVLLLDDVMSELDMNRRKRLLGEIGDMQTFITCTDVSDLEGSGEKRSYAVSVGADECAFLREMTPGEETSAGEDAEPDFT